MMDFKIVGFTIYSRPATVDIVGASSYTAFAMQNTMTADVTLELKGFGVVEKEDVPLPPDAVEEIKAILQRYIADGR
jgi:hypothetical protein